MDNWYFKMGKRIYTTDSRLKKYAIGIGATSVPLVILLFWFLASLGSVEITGYSGDEICAGTELDPCYAYIDFTANEDIFIYPGDWSGGLLLDKPVKEVKMYRKWGKSWSEYNLSEPCSTGNPRCGAKKTGTPSYSIAFREGKDYQIRFKVLKNNPSDSMKWTYFDADPYFYGINNSYKTYDEGEKTFEIKDKTYNTTIISGKLLSEQHLKKDFWDFGYTQVAEFEINSSVELDKLIDDMELIDLENNQTTTKQIDFKYKAYEDIVTTNYKNLCTTLLVKNGTEMSEVSECEQIVVGTEIKKELVWKDLNNSKFRGIKTIGLFTDVKMGDKIEWIPTINSQRIVEWADWEGENLEFQTFTSNGTFETPPGVASVRVLVVAGGGGGGGETNGAGGGAGGIIRNDSVKVSGSITVTIGKGGQGACVGGACIVGQKGANSSFGNLVAVGGGGGLSSSGNPCPVAGSLDGGSGGGNGSCNAAFRIGFGISSQGLEGGRSSTSSAGGGGGSNVSTGGNATVDNGGLGGLSVTHNFTAYSRGGYGCGSVLCGTATNESDNTGNGGNGTRLNVPGKKGGSGIVIVLWESLEPSVTLNSPVNEFNSSSSSINFNGTVSVPSSSIVNVSIIIDDAFNQTNSSGINGTNYIFTVEGLTEGTHNWTYEACNNVSICTNATARNFTIDLTEPFVNLQFPLNITYLNPSPNEINYTASDENNLDACWYSLDEGTTNVTITCGTNVTGLVPNELTNNIWTVYANDTVGNENSSSVTFFVNSSNRDFNITLTNNTLFDFFPLNNTQLAVQPVNQTNITGIMTVHNNFTFNMEIKAKLNETSTNVTFKLGNSSNYSTSKILNTTFQTIYNNLTVDTTVFFWAWADYNNANGSFFPTLTFKGVHIL